MNHHNHFGSNFIQDRPGFRDSHPFEGSIALSVIALLPLRKFASAGLIAVEVDYYAVLEIDKDADERTIKAACRRLVLQWHPDPDAAEEKIRALNEAYECLTDPEKREEYTSWLPMSA